eukprot:12883938-Prorocentrum_lima.AAC.1
MSEGRGHIDKEEGPRTTRTSHSVLPKPEMEKGEVSASPVTITKLGGSNGRLEQRLHISKKRSD